MYELDCENWQDIGIDRDRLYHRQKSSCDNAINSYRFSILTFDQIRMINWGRELIILKEGVLLTHGV